MGGLGTNDLGCVSMVMVAGFLGRSLITIIFR